MLDKVIRLFSAKDHNGEFQERLDDLKKRAPVPVLWLFGKTQSGKTSIIKYLTGAEDAEIGQGFKPCTRFSRQYQFPSPDAPLLVFLDTRGMDEPGYDPREDIAQFNDSAHLLLVTVKVMDHAQENVIKGLRVIHQARSDRPILLALTCLHEAYPQKQHARPFPFQGPKAWETAGDPVYEPLYRSLTEQRRRFEGLVDDLVAIDLTPPEEGFEDPQYGGSRLKEMLLSALPKAFRQTLLTLDEATGELKDLFAKRALPHIAGYSTLAATAGAVPIPWLDMVLLPGIQTRMIYHLAKLYGQPLSGTRFLELASTLGLGIALRQALREVVKFIPYVGSVAGSAMAGASTFALGKAFCYYYSAIHQGHVPRAEDLKRYYQEELALAEKRWWSKGPPK